MCAAGAGAEAGARAHSWTARQLPSCTAGQLNSTVCVDRMDGAEDVCACVGVTEAARQEAEQAKVAANQAAGEANASMARAAVAEATATKAEYRSRELTATS